MRAKASRRFPLPWIIAGLGIALLLWWAVSVYNYGIEVDERGLNPEWRTGDILLFTGGMVCLALAIIIPSARARALRRHS